MRFLSTRAHGGLDYAAGALLVALPWVAGFATGRAEQWVTVGAGALLLLYSLLTDYELGAVRRVGMPVHLWLDALLGAFLAASPWTFGFDQRVWAPHVAVGLVQVVGALLTDTIPSYERRRARA